MSEVTDSVITKEVLTEELRLILKTLLKGERQGVKQKVSDLEKRFETILTLGFAEYFAFLKKGGYIVFDKTNNTVSVTKEGELIAEGLDNASFYRDISGHFSRRLLGEDSAVVKGVKEEPSAQMEQKYVRYEAIGSGGIGTVYRGKHIALGKEIAIKEIKDIFNYINYLQKDELIKRLRREVMAQAQLHHAHILSILDMDCDAQFPYYIMEYAPHGNLRKLMTREGGIPLEISLRYFLQILYGLKHAHHAKVIHQDIKPENILIDIQGNVKIGDFGICRVTEKSPDMAAPIYIGMGTVGYMAPELLHAKGEPTSQSDIYSVGIMFYEMLTGNLPGRRSPMPSEASPDVPKSLDDIFDHMTCDNLSKRYPTVDDILNDFHSVFPESKYMSRGLIVCFDENPIVHFEEGEEVDAEAVIEEIDVDENK